MLRGDAAYMESAEATIEELENMINESKLDISIKEKIFTELDKYKNGLKTLVTKDQETKEFLAANKEAAGAIIEKSEAYSKNSCKRLSKTTSIIQNLQMSQSLAMDCYWVRERCRLTVRLHFFSQHFGTNE